MTVTEKTYVVDVSTRLDILSLFGSAANASAKLRPDLSYHTVNQGLRGVPVRPEEGAAIEDAWAQWKRHYVRGVSLGLEPDLRDFQRPSPEETDDLSDQEIEEWTRRLRPTGPKRRVNL